MEVGTFSDKWNDGIRDSGAYRTPDFDISRRIGGGKAMDIAAVRPVPETETDRSLAQSRQLIEKLRRLVADRSVRPASSSNQLRAPPIRTSEYRIITVYGSLSNVVWRKDDALMNFWGGLFSGDGFMPRIYCGVWSESLIALHVVSDVVIWLSYLWIPVIMLWAYRSHRNQLQVPTAVKYLLLLYVTFITACGFTHFFDALMFWHPVYRINGLVRALTACVSLATAISMIRLVPVAISAPITIYTQQTLLDQQQIWLRDILDSATLGVLRLCSKESELPQPLDSTPETVEIKDPKRLVDVRKVVQRLATAAGYDHQRTDGLITATHEAAMNALRHAGGGTARVYQRNDTMQIWIEDRGPGISLDRLPIATLKQGYSTAGTAGQGWFLVLTFVDAVYLWTGSAGTTLVIEMRRAAPEAVIPFSEPVGGNIAVPPMD